MASQYLASSRSAVLPSQAEAFTECNTIFENNDTGTDCSPSTSPSPSKVPSSSSIRPESTHMDHDGCMIPASAKSWFQSRLEPANIDPPITRVSLSELDDDQLAHNLLLRHDLNFDPKIQYRPTTQGPRSEQRLTKERIYWNAMHIELAGWFIERNPLSSPSACECVPIPSKTPTLRDGLPRLLRMFQTIREILFTMIPRPQWSPVDARLDIDLLSQEMEKGVCNFIALGEWFGALFGQYCLPERDHIIRDMVSSIRKGASNADVQDIVAGLRQLFNVLEIMKLDAANMQIRTIRFMIVDSVVAYEQTDFLQRIAEGWDPRAARIWFSKKQRKGSYSIGALKIAPAITTMIISNSEWLPPTFTLDYIRIRTLQAQFESLMHQASCRWAFEEVAQSLKWEGPIPKTSYDRLFARIAAISSDQESLCNPLQKASDVALEIVRGAYKLCNISKTPTPRDIEFSESNLDYACDVTTSVYQDLRSYLAEDLQDSVEEEVDSIRDLTPMQISNRYHSSSCEAMRSLSQNITQESESLRMAQLTAHISVLHWRVWGPMLYEVPEVRSEE